MDEYGHLWTSMDYGHKAVIAHSPFFVHTCPLVHAELFYHKDNYHDPAN